MQKYKEGKFYVPHSQKLVGRSGCMKFRNSKPLILYDAMGVKPTLILERGL